MDHHTTRNLEVRMSVRLWLAIFVATPAFAALQLPPAITAEATGPNGAIVSYSATSDGGGDDFNGRPITKANCLPASGSTFPLGTTAVQCSSTDGATGSFTVTVLDTHGPALNVPRDFVVIAPSSGGATVTWHASAYDAVDGAVSVTCDPPSGSHFGLGSMAVQCSASDARGNTSAGGFNVRVSSVSDPFPGQPRPDITAEATGPDGAIVTFNNGAGYEDADGRIVADCLPSSGSRFPLGSTQVTCSDSTTFRVHVVDTTAPVLHVPSNLSAQAPDDDGAVVTFEATANDIVDGAIAVECVPASGSRFAVGTTRVHCAAGDSRGNNAFGEFDVTVLAPLPPPTDSITAEATGPGGAIVTFSAGGDIGTGDDHNGRPITGCAPASGSLFPIGTTIVTCSDGSRFNVIVVDTTAPALSVPADITTTATSSDGATVTFEATAADLVDGSVAVVCTPPSGSTFATGTTVVACTASDSRGNASDAAFNVTVTAGDTEAPVIVSIVARPDVLEPPNGQMVDITLDVDVTDNTDPAPLVRIFAVSANEAPPTSVPRCE